MVLPGFAEDGQTKLKETSVVCIGAGGLGSAVLPYLTAAGVGHIGIVDYDLVDEINLHRQIIYAESDIGKSKVESAAQKLKHINSQISITAHPVILDASNAESIISKYDVVVDGSDNFATRYIVNDACVNLNVPLVWGAVLKFDGQVSLFALPNGPCYECVFPRSLELEQIDTCASSGVLGPVAGLIGTVMASETIKLIIGMRSRLKGNLFLYDGINSTSELVKVSKNPECEVCAN